MLLLCLASTGCNTSNPWAVWYSPLQESVGEPTVAAELLNVSSLTANEYEARQQSKIGSGYVLLGRSEFISPRASLDDLEAFACSIGSDQVLYRLALHHRESNTSTSFRPVPSYSTTHITGTKDGQPYKKTIRTSTTEWYPTYDTYHVSYWIHEATYWREAGGNSADDSQ